jgi:hypothetical protein
VSRNSGPIFLLIIPGARRRFMAFRYLMLFAYLMALVLGALLGAVQ